MFGKKGRLDRRCSLSKGLGHDCVLGWGGTTLGVVQAQNVWRDVTAPVEAELGPGGSGMPAGGQ